MRYRVPEGGVVISQSLTKDFGYYVIDGQVHEQEICPRKYYFQNIIKEVDRPGSEYMLAGQYLEQECIGATMGGETVELPRHAKTGKPLKREERIGVQALLFPYVCNKHDIKVIPGANTQVPIIKHLRDRYYVAGTFDVFPSTKNNIDENGNTEITPAIVDIKGTDDVHNEFFGENRLGTSLACWGAPQYLCLNQPLIYKMLSQDINPSLNQHLFEDFKWDQKFLDRVNKIDFHFYFLVMGTGKDITPQDRQLKILRVRPSQERDELLQELLDKTIMAYEYYEKHNWPAKPGKRCGGCPLSPQQCIHKSMEEAI